MKKIVRMCFCVYLFMSAATQAHAYEWKKIAEGLAYTQAGEVHIFQIDPKFFKLSVAAAKDFGLQNATAKELAQKSKAVLAINGGFFSTENKSLGLLLRDGKIINPTHPTQWWGIFYVLNQKPAILLPAAFQKNEKMEMALQAGPRLVIDGKIPSFKPSLDRRSGIGIQLDGKILIVATEDEVSMESFARLFLDLGCSNALNLDGGGSTQLYFNWKDFQLDVAGSSLVTNAITVLPRH